jgi:tRNA-uridine 2-sulfurtransferase
MAERVVVAMSGGVDSSVAAARLVDQGFEVIGVTLHLWDQPQGSARGRCCAPEDVHDARRVADRLGIPHYSLDRRSEFLERVVQPFARDYARGRTPSPCTVCNQTVKLPVLLRIADLAGAKKVATGHYGRVVQREGSWRVARGRDRHKDQSYYLYALGPEVLERLDLVLGDSTKEQVRAEALARGLAGAGKGESQDLCFVSSGGYHDVVERYAGALLRPGFVVDSDGEPLAAHEGVHRFTVGQRKGLGVGAGPARFVTAIDAGRAAVVVGPEAALLTRRLHIGHPTIAQGARLPARAVVQIRYRHEGEPAQIRREGEALIVEFDAPVRAATVGQVAVAYDGECVLAGGEITAVEPGGCA